jgi:hypothetical protein
MGNTISQPKPFGYSQLRTKFNTYRQSIQQHNARNQRPTKQQKILGRQLQISIRQFVRDMIKYKKAYQTNPKWFRRYYLKDVKGYYNGFKVLHELGPQLKQMKLMQPNQHVPSDFHLNIYSRINNNKK